jgi:hypothetical protein
MHASNRTARYHPSHGMFDRSVGKRNSILWLIPQLLEIVWLPSLPHTTTEIEITPEMMRAGADVLNQLDGPLMSETLALQVYLAMVRVRAFGAQKATCGRGDHAAEDG